MTNDCDVTERHDHRTVLHYAVLSGNIDIVRLLLHHGANVRFPSDFQKPTPLDFAILRGNVEMVKLLIDSGADVSTLSFLISNLIITESYIIFVIQVNVGSPIIGLPLHIALSEKVIFHNFRQNVIINI